MSRGGFKERLLAWVDEQRSIDLLSKYILQKLAMFADAEGVAWAQVSTLADSAMVSERTVQARLAELRKQRLIVDTGRTHRLKDSSRSVPLYQLAADVPGLGAPPEEAEAMGANSAPIDPAWVKQTEAMGEAWLHPLRNLVEPKGANAPNAGAREALAGVLREVEGACDVRVLAVSDPSAALAALASLEAQGVDLSDFPDRARRWCASDAFKRLKVPRLQDWLAMGQWRGYPAPAEAPAAEVEIPDPADVIPADVRAGLGEDFAKAWLTGARWIPETRVIVTKTRVAADRVRSERRAQLAALEVRVFSPAEVSTQEVAQ